MSRMLLAAALAACVALPASAATFETFASPASDGSISGVFGDNGGLAAGAFTDTFLFTWPLAGDTSGTISSSFTSPKNDLNFTSVTLNGIGFTSFLGGTGFPEFRLLLPQATLAGLQTLVVKGVSPGKDATYAGTLSFTPGAVPEAATWALMLAGFGGIGALLRRERNRSVTVS